jgi:cytochrome P450/aspartate/methionine/tyrosine aminotransferase
MDFYELMTAAESMRGDSHTIDLSSGSPLLFEELSQIALNELAAPRWISASMLGGYADYDGVPAFLDLIRERWNDTFGWTLHPAEVMVTPGAQGALTLLRQWLAERGQRILYPLGVEFPGAVTRQDPAAGVYASIRLASGGCRAALPAPEALDWRDVGAVILSQPHNPTTATFTAEELRPLLSAASRHNAVLAFDRTYALPGAPMALDLPAPPDDAVHIFSFSKVGLASERTGVLVAPEEIVAELREVQRRMFIQTPKIGQALAAAMLDRLAADPGLGLLVGQTYRDGRLWNRRPGKPPFDLMEPGDADAARKFYEFTLLWPAFSDGPYHDRIRSALVEGLAGVVNPRTRGMFALEAESLLGARVGRRVDWLDEVAWPYSVRVLSIVFGVGADEAERLARLGAMVLEPIGSMPADSRQLRAAFAAMEKLERWLRRPAVTPSSRLLTVLAQICEEPELGPAVATAMLTQVVTGSIDPVVSALCLLAEHVGSGDMARLTTAALREEVLRLATPFRYAARYARCPLEIDGHPVATGDRVILHLAAANVDPSAVPDPAVIQERRRFSHLAFGFGAHYCLGAGVARAAIDALLSAMRQQDVTFHPDTAERAPGESILRYTALTGVLR